MAEEQKRGWHFDTLDELVRHEMERLQIPGVTVGILHDDQVETHAYGVISLATEYPTRKDTLFQIGSNTKVFTATLAMRLVEQGKLDLDAPVREYLPDLRLADEQALARITLRHLLTHTSGLEGDRFEDTGVGDDALRKYVDQSHTWAQETDPGELWSYCNSGFGLAGRMIEQVLGTTYESAMKEFVFDPLGLECSFFFAHEVIMYSAAAGHTQTPGMEAPVVAHPYAIPRASNPAGAIISNVEDVLKFCRFHLAGGKVGETQVLQAEAISAMQQPRVRVNAARQWGIGWALREIDGVRIIEHGGGTNGHISRMLAVPERKLALSALTNSNRGDGLIGKVEEWVFDKYLGLREFRPEHVALSSDELEHFTGTYSRPLGTLVITVQDGMLNVAPTYKNPFSGEDITFPMVKLASIGDWDFIGIEGDWEGNRVEFIRGEGDRPRFVRFGGRLVPRVASLTA